MSYILLFIYYFISFYHIIFENISSCSKRSGCAHFPNYRWKLLLCENRPKIKEEIVLNFSTCLRQQKSKSRYQYPQYI